MTGMTQMLGKALAFAPSAVPGDAWLEYGSGQAAAAAVTVQSVPVSCGTPGPLITLPGGTQLIAGTGAGLLLEPRFGEVAGPFWLWTPGTAPRALPNSPSAEGFADPVTGVTGSRVDGLDLGAPTITRHERG